MIAAAHSASVAKERSIVSLPGFTAEASLGGKERGYSPQNFETQKIPPAANRVTPQQLGLPVYGRYCGPGFGDPTGMTPPIDAVDAVCREHDLCYGRRGYFDCRCDRNLIQSMPGAVAGTSTLEGKIAGTLIRDFFANTPCVCRNRVCVQIPFFGTHCSTVPFPGRGGVGPC